MAEKKNVKPKEVAGDERAASPTGAEMESLGQIRNLLFGAQMEAVEKRIGLLEASLEKKSDGLSTTISTGMGDLRKEMESSNTRIQNSLDDILSALDQLKTSKTDRVALSGLLRGVADKLGSE